MELARARPTFELMREASDAIAHGVTVDSRPVRVPERKRISRCTRDEAEGQMVGGHEIARARLAV